MSKNTFSPLLLDSYEKGCDMANFDFKYLSWAFVRLEKNRGKFNCGDIFFKIFMTKLINEKKIKKKKKKKKNKINKILKKKNK